MRALRRLVSVAVDSADTLLGGCTTHFSSLILPSLAEDLADFPLLVRLNPGIPWKTRGNAAVVLRFYASLSLEKIVDEIYEAVRTYSGKDRAGVVALEGSPWRRELRDLYLRGLTEVLVRDFVDEILNKVGAIYAGGRGVIGAASALAALSPEDDYTFELIAYRSPERWGKERCVRGVVELDSTLPPTSIYNYDVETLDETVAPKGPDPVLAGFRGSCPEHLVSFESTICESTDGWVLFRTNQHTDAHALPLTGELRAYSAGTVRAVVKEDPVILPGGHIVVGTDVADVMFFKESEPLPEIALALRRGDLIEVLGSVRPYKKRGSPVIAAEKLRILKATKIFVELNPRCPVCGKRMESIGRGKGFRCSCGYSSSGSKLKIRLPRSLTGEFTPKRPAHLVKPPWRARSRPLQLARLELASVYGQERPPVPPRICG